MRDERSIRIKLMLARQLLCDSDDVIEIEYLQRMVQLLEWILEENPAKPTFEAHDAMPGGLQ